MLDLQKICKEIEEKSDFRKNLSVQGIEFELGLLSTDQEKAVNNLIQELRGDDDDADTAAVELLDSMRRRTCSYAIRSINGEDIPQYVEIDDSDEEGKKKTVEKDIYLMKSMSAWPGPMISTIFDVYNNLKLEALASIKKSIKYDWYEDPELLKDDDKEDKDESGDKEPVDDSDEKYRKLESEE